MALGNDGNQLIKGYERNLNSSFTNPKPHLVSYRDSGGVLTIGWGHTGNDVFENQTITSSQADILFAQDVQSKAEKWVDRFITIQLSQKQRDALISFTYNAGSGSLQRSEIRKLINKSNHIEAAQAWLDQNIRDRSGTTQPGLILRRKQEAELYLQGTSENQLQEAQGDTLNEVLEEKKIDNNEHIVPYTHSRGLEEMTVDELLNSKRFISTGLQKKEVLELKYKDKTNHRRLFEGLTKTQKRQFNNGSDEYSSEADYPIISGTTIYLSSDKIKIDLTYQSNITTQNTAFNEYWPKLIKTITNDPGYIPSFKADNNRYRDIYPQLSVYVWSRTLYLEQGNVGGFINITDHIDRATIESSMQIGGNFSLTMSPAIGELIVDGEQSSWKEIGDLGPVNLGNLNRKVKVNSQRSEFRRNHTYYEKIIQQNDLVFISFEKLVIEENQSLSDVIENKWIDMIGLVDTVDVISESNANEVSNTIRGRDLIKALMDDNSYFNPYSIGHVNSLYGGQLGDRYFQGEFKNLAAYLATSIKQKVEFVIHRIVSIGYVPDDVFSSFKNKTQVSEILSGGQGLVSNINIETKPAKGIWQICKVFIDPSITNLRLADDSVSNPDGSIMDLFNKIAQYPFVEFFADTYRDKFYLFFRQPPFTEDALSDVVLGYDESQISSSRSIQEDQGNVVKQDGVTDSFINTSTSILIDNDSEDSSNVSNQLQEVQLIDNEFPVIVNISEEDVHSDNLHFSNESYAWYQVEQRGNFAGTTVNLGHVPAIYFDQYAQVFGNKRLNVVSNYSDYKFFEHDEGESDKDLYADQAAQQLAFLVETNMYLPFSRQGSITVNGDRRIKKGNWIFYRPTQEFFYVTNVTNQISITKESIDRITNIQVERGMIRDYLIGKEEIVDGESVEISYFKIVDIPKLRNGIYDTITKGSASDKFDFKSDIAINSKIFNFFLKRRQFV